MNSLAIVKLSALGDILWTLPLVHLLRQRYPRLEITWFVSPQFAPLLQGISGLKIVEFPKPKNLAQFVERWQQLQNLHTTFDVLLCTQTSLRVNFLYPWIKAKRKIGFDPHRGRDGHRWVVGEQIAYRPEHQLEALLGFADYLGITLPGDISQWLRNVAQQKLLVPLRPIDIIWAQEQLQASLPPLRRIVIHPAASSAQRTWSAKNYAEIILRLIQDQQNNSQVYLTGAPYDGHLGVQIEQWLEMLLQKNSPHSTLQEYKAQRKFKNLIGQSSLLQLAALYSLVDVVLAPDTGPIHLADLMNIPTLGLFAAVPASFTGPYLNQHNCIDKYSVALKKFKSKTIDEVPFATRVHHPQLMELISVEEVWSKLQSM